MAIAMCDYTLDMGLHIQLVNTTEDYQVCDLQLHLENQKFPATRNKMGAVACFATYAEADDTPLVEWPKSNTNVYQGWIYKGVVPREEGGWNVPLFQEMEGSFEYVETWYDEVISEWCWRSSEDKRGPVFNEMEFSFADDEMNTNTRIYKKDVDEKMKWDVNPYHCFFERFNNIKTMLLPRRLRDWDYNFDYSQITFDSEQCDIHEWWNRPTQTFQENIWVTPNGECLVDFSLWANSKVLSLLSVVATAVLLY